MSWSPASCSRWPVVFGQGRASRVRLLRLSVSSWRARRTVRHASLTVHPAAPLPSRADPPGSPAGGLSTSGGECHRRNRDRLPPPRRRRGGRSRPDPDHRTACEGAWALAVAVLGALVTNDPPYRSTVLPAPDPSTLAGLVTDYPSAITTVAQALELLDANEDFDTARHHDPNWPTDTESTAVRALRDPLGLQPVPSHQPIPQPGRHRRLNRASCSESAAATTASAATAEAEPTARHRPERLPLGRRADDLLAARLPPPADPLGEKRRHPRSLPRTRRLPDHPPTRPTPLSGPVTPSESLCPSRPDRQGPVCT
ncbi:hypothetical protein SUDANB105_07852 [Streptomyces sp. enrichment culture]